MSVEVIQLPRGGVLIKTPNGMLQVGIPPETIKDTMGLVGEVPDTFVIPNKIFFDKRGISLADVEFPVYFNFFVKKRNVRLIGFQHQLDSAMEVLGEALFGPKQINLTREYPSGTPREHMPDLHSELEFLRPMSLSGNRRAELEEMVSAIPWGHDNRVPFNGIALERTKETLRVVDGKEILAEVSLNIEPSESRFIPKEDKKPFVPPRFGVTVIGSGSGFDANELTSGFILWVNNRGILVDPPVDSTYWLKAMNINPNLIDSCILSHCHDDHDSGILQKLIEEKRINLYTTETIMESFVRKYSSLTGLDKVAFMKLFNFHPISIQVPMRINGGEFRFFYTFHSVPTIGFEVYFCGKSFVHSADTLYDPALYKKLYNDGIMSKHRMIELSNFPWHHSVVFHEAGIPPLHTPIKSLAALPDAVKKNIYLVHLSGKTIPDGCGLKKAPDGMEESIVIPVGAPPSGEALDYLDALNHIDLFSKLPLEKAREFLTLVRKESFKAGEVIIKKGDFCSSFYIILTGQAVVDSGDGKGRIYEKHDYFGEIPMMLDRTSNNSVTAKTDVTLLVMDKYDFICFIRGSEIARHMKIIAGNREAGTSDLFSESFAFKNLSLAQQTQLQSILTRCYARQGEVIAKQGSSCESFYLIDSGKISIEFNGAKVVTAGRGAFAAKIMSEYQNTVMRFTVKAEEDCVYYSVEVGEFYNFLENNPGIFLLMRNARIRQLLQIPADQETRSSDEK